MKILYMEQGTKEWHDRRRAVVSGTKQKLVNGTAEGRRSLIAELIAEEGTDMTKELKATAEMERGTAEEVFAIKEFEKRTGKKVERVGMCVHETRDWHVLSPDGLIKSPNGKYEEAVEVKCPDSKKAILYKIENMVPMFETGLLSKYTKAEMIEILEKTDTPYNPKATISELESIMPPEYNGKPSAQAPFLGIPTEYKWQVVNYFQVNEDLKKLHFVVYDPRFVNDDAKVYIVTVDRDNEILQEAIAEAEKNLESFREDWMRWKDIVLPTEF